MSAYGARTGARRGLPATGSRGPRTVAPSSNRNGASRMQGIAGIVLAAGQGRRAGGVKALMTLHGLTFLERVVAPMRAADCKPVIVVGGADGARVEAEAVRLGAGFVMNEHWQRGQFSSLRVAVNALVPGTAALVALVDHPAVKPETYRTLLEAFTGSSGRIVIPACEDARAGRRARGHPVVLPAAVLAEVSAASDDSTLRGVIGRNASLVLEVQVEDPGVVRDVDTAADLTEIREPGPGRTDRTA